MFTKKNISRLSVFILSVALILLLGRFYHLDAERIEKFLKGFPLYYSGIVFIIFYCFFTFFIWLSKDVFRLIGALLFGAYLSTLFIWVAEIINCLILFHLARYLGRSFVERSLKTKQNNLDERLSRLNFLWILLFRAAPLVPFRFLDLAAGLTGISFAKYLLAAVLGSPLRIFWLQYILSSVGKGIYNNPYALAEFLSADKTLFFWSLMYLILVIIVAFKMKSRD